MTDQKLYKILTFNTNEWNFIKDYANNVTRERCDELIQQFISDGYNPNKLKAVAVDDIRFQAE